MQFALAPPRRSSNCCCRGRSTDASNCRSSRARRGVTTFIAPSWPVQATPPYGRSTAAAVVGGDRRAARRRAIATRPPGRRSTCRSGQLVRVALMHGDAHAVQAGVAAASCARPRLRRRSDRAHRSAGSCCCGQREREAAVAAVQVEAEAVLDAGLAHDFVGRGGVRRPTSTGCAVRSNARGRRVLRRRRSSRSCPRSVLTYKPATGDRQPVGSAIDFARPEHLRAISRRWPVTVVAAAATIVLPATITAALPSTSGSDQIDFMLRASSIGAPLRSGAVFSTSCTTCARLSGVPMTIAPGIAATLPRRAWRSSSPVVELKAMPPL